MGYKITYRLLTSGFLMLAILLSSPAHASQPSPKEYIMGIFPFLPVANLEGIFAPISAELSNAVGKPVKLRLTATYDSFITTLKEDSFDIIHIHPFDYVRFGRPMGYQPLVARSEDLFAQFSVKSNSPIKKIGDLKGKRLGTPPATGSVTYLALDALYKAGITPSKDISIKNFPNHLACVQQLQIGNVDACATSASTLKIFEAQFGIKFKRIGTSITIPHTMFAVHPRVNVKDREIIRKTLISTNLAAVNPRLRALFIESGSSATGRYFKPVSDKDYDPARKILTRIEGK